MTTLTAASRTQHDDVTALFDRMSTAWAQGDGAAYGALFTDDADFVEIRGGLHRGRAAIAAGHQEIFDGIYANSTVSYEVEVVRHLTDHIVVAIVAATMEVPGGPVAGTSRSRFTAVLVDLDGEWRIASFQNTLVASGPPQ